MKNLDDVWFEIKCLGCGRVTRLLAQDACDTVQRWNEALVDRKQRGVSDDLKFAALNTQTTVDWCADSDCGQRPIHTAVAASESHP